MSHAADAALGTEEAETEVQEGGAVPDHEDGEPLVDEAAEEEEHEYATEIPKECVHQPSVLTSLVLWTCMAPLA